MLYPTTDQIKKNKKKFNIQLILTKIKAQFLVVKQSILYSNKKKTFPENYPIKK